MMEINGLHMLIAAVVLFVFIAVRSVQWMTIAVHWRVTIKPELKNDLTKIILLKKGGKK